MAEKKKRSSRTTKKDLEARIAELEAKLAKVSAQTQAKPAEPKPAPTRPAETKPAGARPAETKPAPPPKPEPPVAANNAEALETVYNAWPMTNTHDYKTKTPGYTPGPNRYYARQTAPRGKATTQDWNLQKAKVTGYTAPSNQYFATRQRMAFHPADKRFDGFDFKLEGVSAEQAKTTAPPPPPPPPPKQTLPKGTLPKGMAPPPAQQTTQQQTSQSQGKQQSLQEYENDYLARLERDRKEAAEIQKAAAEIAAKRQASQSTASSSSRGTLPKGF